MSIAGKDTMNDAEVMALLKISGVKDKYVEKAFLFFREKGPGHAEEFYNKRDKRQYREEHMSLEVLKIYLRTLDNEETAKKVLEIWNESSVIDERIRGDFHTHTEFSDGMNTTEEVLETAGSLGYSWIALSDHAPVPGNSYTLTVEKYMRRTEIAEKVSKRLGIDVYHSIEANILEDGGLDIPEEIEGILDFAVASLHKSYGHSHARILERIERALQDERVIALTHPFFAIDPDEKFAGELIALIGETGKAVELNLFPGYFAGNILLLKELLKPENAETRVILSTDAHCVGGLHRMRLGNFFLEHLGPGRVLNTLDELSILGRRGASLLSK